MWQSYIITKITSTVILFTKTGMKQKFMNSMKASTDKLHWTSDCFESSFEKGTVCVFLSYLNNDFLLLSFQSLFIRKRMQFPSMLFLLRLFPLFTRFIILRCILVCLLCYQGLCKSVQSFTFFTGASRRHVEIQLWDIRSVSQNGIRSPSWKLNGSQPKPYLSMKEKCSYCSWLEFKKNNK